MIKIAHIITELNIGGAENMLFNLLSRLDRSEFDNYVISLTDIGSIGKKIQSLGIPVYAFNFKKGPADIFKFLRLSSAVKKIKPRIIQTWLYHADFTGGLLKLMGHKARLVWNIRCSNMDMSRYHFFSRLTRRLCAQLSTLVNDAISNSADSIRHHSKIGYRPEKWHLIPNGIDTGRFRPNPQMSSVTKRKLNIPEDAFVIGAISRYDPMKGHGILFKAFSMLAGDFPGAFLLCAGKGVESSNEKIIRLIGKETKDRVILLGEVEDVTSILPAMDVFVLSSVYGEGFPTAVAEAMSCAIPIVATDTGDTFALVADAGLIVPANNAPALCQALKKMLSSPREETRAMGQAARGRIMENFTLDNIVSLYAKLYRAERFNA